MVYSQIHAQAHLIIFFNSLSGGGVELKLGPFGTAPLCQPQIPLDQTRARTRAAAVGSQRLTVWAMELPPARLFLGKERLVPTE
jgi:hypothetical protein